MVRRIVFIFTLAAIIVVTIRSVRGQQITGWQPISLNPVQAFARLSQPGDIDEGNFTKNDSFLSAGYRLNEDIGLPGNDATPQPYRRHPYGLALSLDESKLYVTSEGNEAEPGSSVVVVDLNSQTITSEIPVGRRPLGITRTPGGRYLVVANQYSNFLSVIDTAVDAEVQRIPSFFYNQKIAFVPERSLMLVTNRALDSLEVYSFSESPVVAQFQFRLPLSTDNRPFGLHQDPG